MILFEKIRWKNFLSTGNQYTEICFTENPTNIIIGANGAGKSTVLDALTFSLFGKAFRKINKPQLVNSVNEKDCRVEVEFSIAQKRLGRLFVASNPTYLRYIEMVICSISLLRH